MPRFLRRILFLLIIAGIVYGVYRLLTKNKSFEKDTSSETLSGSSVTTTTGTNTERENVYPGGEGTGDLSGASDNMGSEGSGTTSEVSSLSGTADNQRDTSQEPLLEKDAIVESGTTKQTSTPTTTKTTTTKKTTTPKKTSTSEDTILGGLFN